MARCNVCKKFLGLFRSRYTCAICGEMLCHDCVVNVGVDSREKIVAFIFSKETEYLDREWKDATIYLCPTCYGIYNSELNKVIELVDWTGKENVRLYSSRYQGKLPKHEVEIPLTTHYHRDKNKAEDEIKVLAATLGCRDVIGVHYNKKSIEDGNYIYSVFQYEGKGIK